MSLCFIIVFFVLYSLIVDDRCDMDLDETDPAGWLRLESAAEEYIKHNSEAFRSVCQRLMLPYQQDERWSDGIKSQNSSKPKSANGTSSELLFWCKYSNTDFFLHGLYFFSLSFSIILTHI